MAYEKVNWTSTKPVNVTNLKKMDDAIERHFNEVDADNIELDAKIGDLSTLNTTEKSNLVDVVNEVNKNIVVNYVDNEVVPTNEYLNGKRIYAYRCQFTQALEANTPYDFNLPFANEIEFAWVDLSNSYLDNSKAADDYNVWGLDGGCEGYSFRLGIAGRNTLSIMADSEWGSKWTYTIMVKFTKITE